MTGLKCTPRTSTRSDSMKAAQCWRPFSPTVSEPRARYNPTRYDFFPSLPTELLLCIITRVALSKMITDGLMPLESFRRERREAGVWKAFPD